MSVCAIIPTFNRAHFLGECLESLFAQSHAIDEIIVVDDGSTDNTEVFIQAYLDRITYVKKENGGKSSAINIALAQTKADYIWICDDDDLADPDGLKHLLEGFEKNPQAGYVYGDYQLFKIKKNGEEHVWDGYTHTLKRSEEPDLKINFLESMFTLQFAMLVKRELYEQVGAFNEEMVRSQDYEMALRMSRVTEGAYTPHVIFYQREHDGIRGSANINFKKALAQEKWLGFEQIIFQQVFKDYEIKEFTPTFAKDWAESRRLRAAQIERGLVMGKRGCWKEAAMSFEEAIKLSDAPLSEEEKHICENIIRWPVAWHALGRDKALYKRMQAIYESGPLGAEIVLSMCRPLIWLSKKALKQEKSPGKAVQHMNTMRKVLGMRGAVRRVYSSLKSRSQI